MSKRRPNNGDEVVVTLRGEVSQVGQSSFVIGDGRLGGTNIIFPSADHVISIEPAQPKPEPGGRPDWVHSSVEVARATVSGMPNVVVMRDVEKGWWVSQRTIYNVRAHPDEDVTDRVPLRLVDESKYVVLDPEDNKQVRALWLALSGADIHLRSMLKPVEPPIPPMPEGDDWVALDRAGDWWAPEEIVPGGWAGIWKAKGPLTIYRKEES